MPNLNETILFAVNNLAGKSKLLDSFFIFLTDKGFYIFIALVFCWLLFILFKTNEAFLRLKLLGNATFVFISIFLTWGFVWYLKVIFSAPRPFEIFSEINNLIAESSNTSFPSSHSAAAFALATSVFFINKTIGKILFILGFLVGVSRIYLGVHFPIDVFVGFCIGIFIPFILKKIFFKKT